MYGLFEVIFLCAIMGNHQCLLAVMAIFDEQQNDNAIPHMVCIEV
jgi:hypothetical protein